ncbi:MAG: Rpn family recombination-promoting nuclease/putative transposase, partial [Candidatus Methylumidiphilus sp.]
LPFPVADVEILNPYNDKEFLSDKLNIVDVKARDKTGRVFQVEIQLLSHRHLLERMAYTWCDIYSQQLQSGQSYSTLRPVYSIWLLAENLLPESAEYAHEYRLRDRNGQSLGDAGSIYLLELHKFAAERIESEQHRWLKFFKEGGQLDDANLPDWMNTNEMRQAMNTLKLFSEKERDYHAYQARQNFLREQQTIQEEMEQMQRDKEQAEQQAERYRLESQAAQAEIERLKALLANLGQTP